MGSWSISVHGHGIHDNGKEGDVDKLLEKFITDLEEKGGHVVDAVHLTVGGGRKYVPAHGQDPVSRGRTVVEYF